MNSPRNKWTRLRTLLAGGAVTAVMASPTFITAAEPQKNPPQLAEGQENPGDAAPAPLIEIDDGHVNWTNDLAEAQKIARAENKDLLLFFTGSDWCGFCVRLEKAVLTTPEFTDHISTRYVPVVLDFPRGKQLPEQITEQNEKLKNLLAVSGFPAIFTVDPNVLPYGKINGFGGAEPFWEKLKGVSQLGDRIREAKGNVDIASINNPKVLDQVVSQVPENLLSFGWPAQLERFNTFNDSESLSFKEKWSGKLDDLQKTSIDREVVAQASEELRRLQREKAHHDTILAFFDSGLSEAQGRPIRLKFYLNNKAQFLQHIGAYDQAIEVVKELAASSWPTQRERTSINSQYRRLLFNAGRIDEGVALIADLEKKKNHPSEEARQDKIILNSAKALYRANQASASLDYLQRVFHKIEPDSFDELDASHLAEAACRATGRDHELRGQASLNLGRAADRTGNNAAYQVRAAEAAISFRAANRNDLVLIALGLLDDQGEIENEKLNDDQEDVKKTYVERQSEQIPNFIKIAQGSQGDALLHFAKTSRSVGRGVYLIEAAIAYRTEGRNTEAEALATEAINILEELDPKFPDQASVQHLHHLAKKWTDKES